MKKYMPIYNLATAIFCFIGFILAAKSGSIFWMRFQMVLVFINLGLFIMNISKEQNKEEIEN